MSEKAPSTSASTKGRLVRGLFKLTGYLPFWLLRLLGVLVGNLNYWTKGRSAKITQQNLAMVYPDLSPADRNSFVRRSLSESAKTMLEIGAIWAADQPRLLSKIVSVEGRELLDEKLAKGKGVFVIAPHFGNWEVLGRYLTECGSVTNLYQPPAYVEVDELMYAGRARTGAKLAPTNRRGVSTLLKALSAGEMVGILPDQVPTQGSGEFAPFFSIPALTMTLCYQLNQRTQSEFVLGLAKRVPGGFAVIFAQAHSDIYSDDIETALAGLNKTVEACIAYAPEQYSWEYKRYRRQPDDQPSPYKKTWLTE